MFWLAQRQTAAEYLQHVYRIPEKHPPFPLSDETFVADWQEISGRDVLDFFAGRLSLPTFAFRWENEDALRLSFVRTLGGRLSVISTGNHEDFRAIDALMNGMKEKRELPLTVNAFTIEARADKISHHRLLLLNHAPYSNVPATKLGLTEEDWLERSYRLCLAHECAHYETLRLKSIADRLADEFQYHIKSAPPVGRRG